MKTVWFHPSQPADFAIAAEFLHARIGNELAGWAMGTIMAVVNGGAMISAVLFHNYDNDAQTIEISAASDSKEWLTRSVLNEIFAFPFLQLKTQAVVARMDAARPLTRIFQAYGFKRFDIPLLRGRNTVEAIMVLSDADWRASKFNKGLKNG